MAIKTMNYSTLTMMNDGNNLIKNRIRLLSIDYKIQNRKNKTKVFVIILNDNVHYDR